jgi:hypothetical protein
MASSCIDYDYESGLASWGFLERTGKEGETESRTMQPTVRNLEKEDDENAQKLIKFCARANVDYSLLLYLQLPQSMIDHNPTLKQLDSICADLGALVRRRNFYQTIETHLLTTGISEITPQEFIYARSKDEAHTEYEKKKDAWGIHIPFFFQAYATGMSRSIFILTRTWQDGLHRLLMILKQGNLVHKCVVYEICGAIEQVLDDSTINFAIFDCERYAREFKDVKTIQEIKDTVLNFPATMGGLLVSAEVVDEEIMIDFEIKDRCRGVKTSSGPDYKVSYHFVSSLAGTKELHSEATKKSLKKYVRFLQYVKDGIKAKGNILFLPRDQIGNPNNTESVLTFVDLAALPGGPNGFTTMLSRKEKKDEFPRLVGKETVCCGVTFKRFPCTYIAPHNLDGRQIDDGQRLDMLRRLCITTPRLDVAYYSEAFIKEVKDTPKVLSRI